MSCWRRLAREKGDVRRGPLGGDRNSWRVEAHRTVILGIFDANPDMSTEELQPVLRDLKGLSFGYGPPWRLLKRCGYTRKQRPVTRRSQSVRTS